MTTLRHSLAALKVLLVLTVLLGVAYPLAITGVARLMPGRADGSMIVRSGSEVGSALLGQSARDPRWFHARPSASDWSGETSGGSNLGPGAPAQLKVVADREAALRATNPDATGPVPADAVTASGSGLDPDISPAYAAWQAPRVATASGLPLTDVQRLVVQHTDHAPLGFFGTDSVNVTELNVALTERLDR